MSKMLMVALNKIVPNDLHNGLLLFDQQQRTFLFRLSGTL